MVRYSDLTRIRLKLPSGVCFQARVHHAVLQDEIPTSFRFQTRQGQARVLEKALPPLERCAHHFVQRLWGPFHSCNVTEISRADLLVRRQDRHSFQGTGKMKALVNFQSLSFNTSGENFLIWKQTDQEILKGFLVSKATSLPSGPKGTHRSPRSYEFPLFRYNHTELEILVPTIKGHNQSEHLRALI